MFGLFSRASPVQTSAKQLYGKVVAEARQPVYYASFGVPDTPEGRYEMIVLVLTLVLERLRQEGTASQTLSQAVIEAFVANMDDSMREMGVGDMAVPKRVKRAAAGLYERAGRYRLALTSESDDGLSAALREFTGIEPANAFVARVRALARHVATLSYDDLIAARFNFESESG